MNYASAGLLNLCLHAFSDRNSEGKVEIDVWRCVYCLIGILAVKIAANLMEANLWFFLDNLIGVKIVYMIKCFLFDKALKKPIGRDKEFGIGEITNMNDSDIKQLSEVAFQAINLF